jgi:hypothetical protein
MKNLPSSILLLVCLTGVAVAHGEDEKLETVPNSGFENPTEEVEREFRDFHDNLLTRPPRVKPNPVQGPNNTDFPSGWTDGTHDSSLQSLHTSPALQTNQAYLRHRREHWGDYYKARKDLRKAGKRVDDGYDYTGEDDDDDDRRRSARRRTRTRGRSDGITEIQVEDRGSRSRRRDRGQ